MSEQKDRPDSRQSMLVGAMAAFALATSAVNFGMQISDKIDADQGCCPQTVVQCPAGPDDVVSRAKPGDVPSALPGVCVCDDAGGSDRQICLVAECDEAGQQQCEAQYPQGYACSPAYAVFDLRVR